MEIRGRNSPFPICLGARAWDLVWTRKRGLGELSGKVKTFSCSKTTQIDLWKLEIFYSF